MAEGEVSAKIRRSGAAARSEQVEAVQSPSPRARWILCASAKGGSGKTTTTLNLAVLAAAEGRTVLLVDLDGQRTLSWWARQRPKEAPPVTILTKKLADMSEKADGLAEIDAKAAEIGADLVIIDTPPSVDDWPTETIRVVRRADLTLIPTGQGTPDLNSVVEWMAILRGEGAKAAFLLNQADRAQTSFERARVRLNKAGLLCPIDVRRLADVRSAFDHGLGVVEIGGSNAAQEFAPVWDFAKNIMGMDR
jgi:chromosome partitioning protein